MEELLELLNISKVNLREKVALLGINTLGVLFLLYNVATVLNNIINSFYYDTAVITLNTLLGFIVPLLIFILGQLVKLNYRSGNRGKL